MPGASRRAADGAGPGAAGAGEAGDRRPLFGDLSVDAGVDAVLSDLDDYWGDELLARFGISYAPPRRVQPVRPDVDPALRCGTKPVAVESIRRNALYCPADDYVAWDAGYLPDLAELAGPFSVGLVVAHEWGHLVQDRTGWPTEPVIVELQADCYAGAWAAHVARGESRRFRLARHDLDAALAGFLRLQDGSRPGTAGADDRHGTAFDRVAAFEDGNRLGSGRCAGYRDAPPDLVSLPVTAEDVAGRQTPIDQLVAVTLNNLDVFWAATVEAQGVSWRPLADPLAVMRNASAGVTCGGVPVDPAVVRRGAWLCPSEGRAGVNVAGLARLADSLGDFAAVLVLSSPWAEAVASMLGRGDPDCLAGGWVGGASVGIDDATVQALALSGSDLDEAVAGLLAGAASGGGGARPAFDRVEAFRQGYTGGVSGCLATG